MSDARGRGASGATFGLASVAAALVVVPATLRVAAAGAGVLPVWVGLAGGSALLVGPVVALAASLGGPGRLVAPGVGIGLSAAPVALLGAMLKATTHHRPLGAATFGVLALALVLAALFVAARAFSAFHARPTPGHRALVALLMVLALASFGGVLVVSLADPGLRAHVIDGSLLVVAAAAALGGQRWLPRVAWLGLAGWGLWGILVLGSAFLGRSGTFEQLRERAPVLAGPAAWL